MYMKKILLIVGIVALFATSCSDDYLDVRRYGQTEDIIPTSQDNVERYLNGVYDLMYPEKYGFADQDQQWLLKPHMAMSNYPTLDIQPDGWDVAFSRQAWTTDQAEFSGGWQRAYRAIVRANDFIQILNERVDPAILTGGAATAEKMEAEARGIRGYFYTWLVQNFGGVPMLLTGDSYGTTPNKKRDTAEDAWNLIIEDFEYAANHLDWTPRNGEKGRVTKGMALAYLGQAHMYNENWAEAKATFRQIIDSGVYSLNPCFGQIDVPGNNWQAESIWEVAFTENQRMGPGAEADGDNLWIPSQLKGSKEYGAWGPHYVSYEFTYSFEPGDKRLQYEIARYGGYNEWLRAEADPSIFDIQIKDFYGFANYISFTPDYGRTGASGEWRAPFVTSDLVPYNSDTKHYKMAIDKIMPNGEARKYNPISAILMRYAAVLLNYAECCFELEGDNSAEGWEYIQKIRERAFGKYEVNASKTAYPGAQFYNGTFPFELNTDPGLVVPDAKTFYANYKRAAGPVTGKYNRFLGQTVTQKQYTGTVPIYSSDAAIFAPDWSINPPDVYPGDMVSAPVPNYQEFTYTSTYNYKPYTSPAWKVALVIERRHEFFAEYSLWYDICRTGMAKEYLDAEYPMNNEALNWDDSLLGATGVRTVNNPHTVRIYEHNVNREIYPIPLIELTSNSEMSLGDQNPGY
jgi:hypothetical protein